MLRQILILSITLVVTSSAFSQRHKRDKQNQPAPPPTNSWDEKTKRCEKIEGLFTFYRDTTSGTLYLMVEKEQLDKPFIYFSYVENGNTITGHNRGNYKGSKVFKITKSFQQLEFSQINTNYYFNPENELSKASNANVTNALMASEKIIVSKSSNDAYLIEADNLFLNETFMQIKHPTMGNPFIFNLGSINKAKTKYHEIHSYKNNSDIIVRYIFDNPAATGAPSGAITDARYMEVMWQHSFIALPDSGFTPRLDDPRIGYFITQTNDMTTTKAVNYRDFIHRWRLVKKYPNNAISEPIKPIVWWIENTTPKELRSTIKSALLEWNKAFEKAGFKNAIQVYEQPDTATWQAGDINYNVLRWTSSPEPLFGGYGPSFVNPLTGEILGADIMLEWVFLTNRIKAQKVFDQHFTNIFDESNNLTEEHTCNAANYLHSQNILGSQLLHSMDASKLEIDTFLKESLYYLVLHEVGHTLGLNHNMKASQLHSLQELYDIKRTKEIGLTGSVMDYPAINFSNRKNIKTQYYTDKPGPYDLWAIEFGYYHENSVKEDSIRREKILQRSTEPSLTFGNDADDMRAPGKGIDPRVMIGDMSSNAVDFAKERIQLIQQLLLQLKENYTNNNSSYQELYNQYMVLITEWGIQAGIASRYIGGVYVDRSFTNQNTTNVPYQAVDLETQKKSMKLLDELVFASSAFQAPANLTNYLQTQRRGFNFFSKPENPSFHQHILAIQKSVLNHLLHPQTLARMNDSKILGNVYSQSTFFNDLTQSIFKPESNNNYLSFRQNLQIELVQMYLKIMQSQSYDNLSQSKALFQLKWIEKNISTMTYSLSAEGKEHAIFITHLIKEGLAKK